MLATSSTHDEAQSTTLAPLPVITTPVRQLNTTLWELLSRPGPLTAEEWAYIEEQERAGQADAGQAL